MAGCPAANRAFACRSEITTFPRGNGLHLVLNRGTSDLPHRTLGCFARESRFGPKHGSFFGPSAVHLPSKRPDAEASEKRNCPLFLGLTVHLWDGHRPYYRSKLVGPGRANVTG